MSYLKVGDKVKITRKPKDHERGWGDAWVNQMDNAINKIGIIKGFNYEKNVLIEINGHNNWYPPFVLEKVDERFYYIEGHKNCGLKVGDKVKITRKAFDTEQGWGNLWSPKMDEFLGKTYEIIKDCKNEGFKLNTEDIPWIFPYFVLEKIDPYFQEGDKGTCFIYGKGIVESFDTYYIKEYPVLVRFSNGIGKYYTEDGKLFDNGDKCLFHGHNVGFHLKVTGVEKPKRKVIKYYNLYWNKDENIITSGFGFDDYERAKRMTSGNDDYIKTIEVNIKRS